MQQAQLGRSNKRSNKDAGGAAAKRESAIIPTPTPVPIPIPIPIPTSVPTIVEEYACG
jgi:hypothetical protein